MARPAPQINERFDERVYQGWLVLFRRNFIAQLDQRDLLHVGPIHCLEFSQHADDVAGVNITGCRQPNQLIESINAPMSIQLSTVLSCRLYVDSKILSLMIR